MQAVLTYRLQLSGPDKDNVKEEALRLSRKYSFVTPLTSMVVTKPNGETTDVLHKPKEGAPRRNDEPGHHGEPGVAGPPFFSSNMFLVSHPGMINTLFRCDCVFFFTSNSNFES